MGKFTEAEAKELGEPLELLNKWQFVMDTLWGFFTAYARTEKAVTVEKKDNKILFRLNGGNDFKIFVNLYNRKYLSLCIEIEGNDEFRATVNNIDAFGKAGIIRTVSNILTYAENIKN